MSLSARLDFTGDKCSFHIQGNPLIHALDEKLQASQASSVKLLFEYLKTEEYREYVVNMCVCDLYVNTDMVMSRV